MLAGGFAKQRKGVEPGVGGGIEGLELARAHEGGTVWGEDDDDDMTRGLT